MEPYRVEFTPLASAIAQTKYSLESVEAKVRLEIAKFNPDDPEAERPASIDGLICMMVTMAEKPDFEDADDPTSIYFFCDSVEDGVLRVDLGEFEDIGVIKTGPFAGKSVMAPRRMSDEAPANLVFVDDVDEDE
jgi:hypothetical protein